MRQNRSIAIQASLKILLLNIGYQFPRLDAFQERFLIPNLATSTNEQKVVGDQLFQNSDLASIQSLSVTFIGLPHLGNGIEAIRVLSKKSLRQDQAARS